ncbi:MAG: FAD-dependent oxidoreductase, partial [Synergistaceae bacterium]|nr:FAD-dependent oxidoreductase [Synergistaceae bacterium]
MKEISTDILVIGGGAAGLSAAAEASASGCTVTVIESDLQLGGQLIKQTHKFFGSKEEYAGTRGFEIAKILMDEIKECGDRVQIHTNTTVTGYYREDGLFTAMRGEESYFRIRAKRAIVASGAQERI